MRTLSLTALLLLACGGQTGSDPGPTAGNGGSAGSSVDAGGGGSESGGGGDAAEASVNPCSGKTCGTFCRSWRVNAEVCDIDGVCNEANFALCSCNPCGQGCEFLHLCEAGRD